MTRHKRYEPPREGCHARYHDTASAYRDPQVRCRCPLAVAANRVEQRRHERRRIATAPHGWHISGRPGPGTPVSEASVQMVLAGHHERLTTLELAVAIEVLDGRRWSARRIAAHLRCAIRTVQRHRARRRAEATS